MRHSDAERLRERLFQGPEIEEAIALLVGLEQGELRSLGRREKSTGDIDHLNVAIDALDVDPDVGLRAHDARHHPGGVRQAE